MQHPPLNPSPFLTITLFGGLSIQCGDRGAHELPSQKTASLLAYLALISGSSTPRPELLALLWPDSVQEKASQNLRQCLRTLRLLLEQPPFAEGSVLLANRTEVRLNPEVIRSDVHAFECAIEAAKQTTERAERVVHLARATELYRGELLPGFYLDLFVAERHRLAEVHRQALHLLVQDLEAAGDLDRSLHYAHRAALLDPLSESACSALMRLYATLGEPSAVLRVYQEWEARHITEFGEPPNEVSREIAQRWQQTARQQTLLRKESAHPPVTASCPETEREDTTASTPEITAPLPSAAPTGDETAPAQRLAPVVANRPRYLPAFVIGIALSLILLVSFTHIGLPSESHSRDTELTQGAHSPAALPHVAVVPQTASTPAAPKPTGQRVALPNLRGHPTPDRIASTSSLEPGTGRTNPLRRSGRSGDIRDFPVSRSRPFGPPAASGSATRPLALPLGVGSPPEGGSGEALWSRYYPLKPGDKDDQPTAMTTDPAGNIYITGFVNTFKTDVDYQTLKYSPSGRLLWEQRYNGPGNDLDRAKAIAVDAAGNVYITGESDGGKGTGPGRLNSLDIATIKYSPEGKKLWVERYDGPGHGMDSGTQIGLDSANNVYVFGHSWGGSSLTGCGVDLVLLKYAPDGTLKWSRRYPIWDTSETAARAMVLDHAGGVYVTATVHKVPLSGVVSIEGEVLTLKYDEEGQLLWERRYTGPTHEKDEPTCIALDRENNVFVVGFTGNGSADGVANEGYLVLKYYPNGKLAWERNHCWAGYIDRPASATTDSAGDLYITGQAQVKHDGTDAFGTLGYDANGALLWADTYRGTGAYSCRAVGLAINSEGEIYVTGMARYVDPLKPNQATADRQACVTFAYSSDGHRGRLHRYFKPAHLVQGPICIGVDENDNVLVAGQMAPNGVGNTVILKYAP